MNYRKLLLLFFATIPSHQLRSAANTNNRFEEQQLNPQPKLTLLGQQQNEVRAMHNNLGLLFFASSLDECTQFSKIKHNLSIAGKIIDYEPEDIIFSPDKTAYAYLAQPLNPNNLILVYQAEQQKEPRKLTLYKPLDYYLTTAFAISNQYLVHNSHPNKFHSNSSTNQSMVFHNLQTHHEQIVEDDESQNGVVTALYFINNRLLISAHLAGASTKNKRIKLCVWDTTQKNISKIKEIPIPNSITYKNEEYRFIAEFKRVKGSVFAILRPYYTKFPSCPHDNTYCFKHNADLHDIIKINELTAVPWFSTKLKLSLCIFGTLTLGLGVLAYYLWKK